MNIYILALFLASVDTYCCNRFILKKKKNSKLLVMLIFLISFYVILVILRFLSKFILN